MAWLIPPSAIKYPRRSTGRRGRRRSAGGVGVEFASGTVLAPHFHDLEQITETQPTVDQIIVTSASRPLREPKRSVSIRAALQHDPQPAQLSRGTCVGSV